MPTPPQCTRGVNLEPATGETHSADVLCLNDIMRVWHGCAPANYYFYEVLRHVLMIFIYIQSKPNLCVQVDYAISKFV